PRDRIEGVPVNDDEERRRTSMPKERVRPPPDRSAAPDEQRDLSKGGEFSGRRALSHQDDEVQRSPTPSPRGVFRVCSHGLFPTTRVPDHSMAQQSHVVLLGDSIFDNGAYTHGAPDVLYTRHNP